MRRDCLTVLSCLSDFRKKEKALRLGVLGSLSNREVVSDTSTIQRAIKVPTPACGAAAQ